LDCDLAGVFGFAIDCFIWLLLFLLIWLRFLFDLVLSFGSSRGPVLFKCWLVLRFGTLRIVVIIIAEVIVVITGGILTGAIRVDERAGYLSLASRNFLRCSFLFLTLFWIYLWLLDQSLEVFSVLLVIVILVAQVLKLSVVLCTIYVEYQM